MSKNRIGELPDIDDKLLYPLQSSAAGAGGPIAAVKTNLELNQSARRSSIIRFQQHFQLIFAGAGTQLVRPSLYALNFFHITKLHFNIFAAPAAITIYYSSGQNAVNIFPITPWLTGLGANAYTQQDTVLLPLNAISSGDSLWCTVNGACTISGEVIGWESPEQYPVDLPIK